MNPKKMFSRDPVLNRIMILENRVAVLEGKEPPHGDVCRICGGTEKVPWGTPMLEGSDDCPVCKKIR